MTRVIVVRTGTANLASVLAAFARAGVEASTSHDPTEVLRASHVVLPGVGAFGAALDALRQQDLEAAVQERAVDGRPFLGICLGLQMLTKRSEETPGVDGLSVLDTEVVRFAQGIRAPQLGWNKVQPTDGAKLLTPGYAYFANTYHLAEIPEGWQGAHADHGGPFVAAVERGPALACQFHPELSGQWGQSLIARWLEGPC